MAKLVLDRLKERFGDLIRSTHSQLRTKRDELIAEGSSTEG